MLLLPIILASDLKGAEEESGILRLLVLFLSQIHRCRLPAGGALGLEGAQWPPRVDLISDLQTLHLGHNVSNKEEITLLPRMNSMYHDE